MKSNLTRRVLISSGLATASLVPLKLARGTSIEFAVACKLTPEQALGPYYLADELLRSDIRAGKSGVPLVLHLLLRDARTCEPVPDAAVDVWHCDADGAYSGFDGDSHRFLRGIQLTDRDGVARFSTIFPGCYPGRTNHIHFQVRTAGAVAGETYRGGHVAHTGQVFFPEETTLRLMQESAYAAGSASRMAQAEDGIFRHQAGAAATARLTPIMASDPSRGYEAALVATIDPSEG